jgi:hypothetical protein
MYKNATKCNETIGKWCKNKHGASKIIDTFETYQASHEIFGYDSRWEKASCVPMGTWRGSNPAIPIFQGFRFMRGESGIRQTRRRSINDEGHTKFYPGSAPRRVKTYILLVWSCIASICGAVTKVRRCNLAEVEGDGVASLCEFACLGGCPWWLYICSQLGFTSSFCLLLQVKVMGLAGFGYPSSGLLPWQEPGRQISRTDWSYPRQEGMMNIAARFSLSKKPRFIDPKRKKPIRLKVMPASLVTLQQGRRLRSNELGRLQLVAT